MSRAAAIEEAVKPYREALKWSLDQQPLNPHRRPGASTEAIIAGDEWDKQFYAARALIEAAPALIELGDTWHGYTLEFYPEHGVHAYIRESPVDMELDGAWWKPGWKISGARPLLCNALLTAYRRAVDWQKRYGDCPGATWPKGWEWAITPMPTYFAKHHMTDQVWLGVDSHNPLHTYPWPLSGEAESKRRAAMLGLCEAKPAPGCRDFARCASLLRADIQPCCGCTDYEPDDVFAPAPVDAKAGLTRAGFYVVDTFPHNHDSMTVASAYPLADGRFRVTLYCDSPDRAEAALLASQGKLTPVEGCEGWCPTLRARKDHLAAKEAEIVRLKVALDEEQRVRLSNGAEISRLTAKLADATSNKFTYCAYCGERTDAGSDKAGEIITKHIRTCPSHPMREVEKEVTRLKGEIADMMVRL